MPNHPPTQAQLRKLATGVGQQLTKLELSLALAESCTGGLLSSILTDIPGSSRYVRGGVIAYSNFAKTHLLAIPPEMLEANGAVSAPVARTMAQTIRQHLQTNIGLAVTGITGPGGGTPEKPVGLVYLHLIAEDADQGAMHIWQHDREGNKRANVAAALHLLQRYVEKLANAPHPAAQKTAPSAPLLVEATWRGGTWRPQAAWLHGRRQTIIGVGRQQRNAQGQWRLMVEFSNGDRAELQVDVASGVWQLLRHWPARRYA
jgi:PncC family amidohydrolase